MELTLHECLNWSQEKFRRKIDQEWDMAGCARQDGDTTDENKRTEKARRLEQLYREIYGR